MRLFIQELMYHHYTIDFLNENQTETVQLERTREGAIAAL